MQKLSKEVSMGTGSVVAEAERVKTASLQAPCEGYSQLHAGVPWLLEGHILGLWSGLVGRGKEPWRALRRQLRLFSGMRLTAEIKCM